MALEVEDGTGKSNADAYATLAYVDTYHSDRGHTLWTGIDSLKEAAIRKATDYADKYPKGRGRRFRGLRETKDQALEWPRAGALDDDNHVLDDVPTSLQKAVAEYALRALVNGELAPDHGSPYPAQSNATGTTDPTESNSGEVKRKRVKAGPVETETDYVSSADSGSGNDFTPNYPAADLLLEELLQPVGGATVVRI